MIGAHADHVGVTAGRAARERVEQERHERDARAHLRRDGLGHERRRLAALGRGRREPAHETIEQQRAPRPGERGLVDQPAPHDDVVRAIAGLAHLAAERRERLGPDAAGAREELVERLVPRRGRDVDDVAVAEHERATADVDGAVGSSGGEIEQQPGEGARRQRARLHRAARYHEGAGKRRERSVLQRTSRT